MKPEDFGIDLNALLTPPDHVWVGSGRTTVKPLENTAAGVSDFISAPWAALGFTAVCRFTVDGSIDLEDTGNRGKDDVGILYSGGTWLPDGISRRGTYHHVREGGLLSFALESLLTPSFDAPGFVLTVRLTNRSPRSLRAAFRPKLGAGLLAFRPLDQWGYGPPKTGREPIAGADGRSWSTEEARLSVDYDDRSEELAPGGTLVRHLSVEIGKAGAVPAAADPGRRVQATRQAWVKRIDSAFASLPRIDSDIPGLKTFYDRSVLCGLACVWEHPEFALHPQFATAGMDGGCLCSYLWDLAGYLPRIAPLAFGDALLPTMRAMHGIGLDRHYAVTPAGTGIGVSYAYSVWSFVSLVWGMALIQGPSREFYEAARKLTLWNEEKEDPGTGLIDYGTQKNLLEMRAAGWEHVTASPNAERAFCLRRIADLGDFFGDPGAAALRARAARILEVVRRTLWNEREGWFDCLYPDGRRETVYSIQVFDAVRAGAATPSMKRRILEKLSGAGFLGAYGVSSVGREDRVHYEVNDPDWSGSGAYTGEAPQLAQTLFEQDETALAWDVLGRLFWMGRHLVLFPQEHYADRPALPAHKRANVISGMCGAEALVFSAFGIEPALDGSCRFTPHAPPAGFVSLDGLRLRGRTVDARMSAGSFRLVVDGSTVHDGPPVAVEAWRA